MKRLFCKIGHVPLQIETFKTPDTITEMEWHVLHRADVETETGKDRYLLLMSRYGVFSHNYSDSHWPKCFEHSTLARLLNTDYLNLFFTEEEKAALVPFTRSWYEPEYYDVPFQNPYMIIPSMEELERFRFEAGKATCIHPALEQLRNKLRFDGPKDSRWGDVVDENGGCNYWLRSSIDVCDSPVMLANGKYDIKNNGTFQFVRPLITVRKSCLPENALYWE